MNYLDFRTWNIKKIIKEIVIMMLIVFVVSNVLSYVRQPNLKNSEVPMMKTSLITKELIDLKTFEGKPLMIHFWATWCPTCKAEADNIQRLSQYYDVVSIAVKSGSDKELLEYMKGRGFDYRVINDQAAKWASLYNIEGYPTTFIYNREGKISFSEVGYTSTLGLALRLWWAGL